MQVAGITLVTLTDIAKRHNVSRQAAHKWTENDTFPTPIGQLAKSRVWLLLDVEDWLRTQPRKARNGSHAE